MMFKNRLQAIVQRVYQTASGHLSPRAALTVKNFLQRILELRARMAGLHVSGAEHLIPVKMQGRTIFVVAPGRSLQSLSSEQWIHLGTYFSIGLGGVIFHNRQLDSYLSEHPPVLTEIRAELEKCRITDERVDWEQKLGRLSMKLVPRCVTSLRSYRRDLLQLNLETMPHLKIRYLSERDKDLFLTEVERDSALLRRGDKQIRGRFPQTSSSLPSVVYLGCIRKCSRIVLVGTDLSGEYFSDSQTEIYNFDLAKQEVRSTDNSLHITESGKHLSEWQTVTSQIQLYKEMFPSTEILIGTPVGPLAEILELYSWQDGS